MPSQTARQFSLGAHRPRAEKPPDPVGTDPGWELRWRTMHTSSEHLVQARVPRVLRALARRHGGIEPVGQDGHAEVAFNFEKACHAAYTAALTGADSEDSVDIIDAVVTTPSPRGSPGGSPGGSPKLPRWNAGSTPAPPVVGRPAVRAERRDPVPTVPVHEAARVAAVPAGGDHLAGGGVELQRREGVGVAHQPRVAPTRGGVGPCIDCGGPKPPQTIGRPRLRCLDCAERERLRLAAEHSAARSRERLALPARRCLICEGPIERVSTPGRRRQGRIKYCSPACDAEARLRLKRAARGGVKHPQRVVAQLLRSHAIGVAGDERPVRRGNGRYSEEFVTLRLDPEVTRALRVLAADRHVSLTDYLRDRIANEVEMQRFWIYDDPRDFGPAALRWAAEEPSDILGFGATAPDRLVELEERQRFLRSGG